jgi:hypothetical protein
MNENIQKRIAEPTTPKKRKAFLIAFQSKELKEVTN